MHTALGGNTARILIQIDKKDFPYNMTSCLVIKAERKEYIHRDDICFLKKSLHLTRPAFLEMAEHLPDSWT